MGSRAGDRASDLLDFSPWRLAAAWGNPDKGRRDILSTARSLLGIATVIAVNIYAGSRDFTAMLDDELWAKTLFNVVLAGSLLPVAMVLVHLLTHRHLRSELRYWPVFRSIGLMIGTGFLPLLGFVLLTNWISGSGILEYQPTGSTTERAVGVGLVCLSGVIIYLVLRTSIKSKLVALFVTVSLVPIVGPLLIVLLATLIILTPIAIVVVYVSCVAFWASRTCCWVGLFHPLLSPTMSAVVVTTFTVAALVDINTHGVPVALWLWVTLGGLVSTLALATAEWIRLRKQGFRYREGPRPFDDTPTEPIYLPMSPWR